jgi:hypothetical protein
MAGTTFAHDTPLLVMPCPLHVHLLFFPYLKKNFKSHAWWFMPVISATQEEEISRIMVWG